MGVSMHYGRKREAKCTLSISKLSLYRQRASLAHAAVLSVCLWQVPARLTLLLQSKWLGRSWHSWCTVTGGSIRNWPRAQWPHTEKELRGQTGSVCALDMLLTAGSTLLLPLSANEPRAMTQASMSLKRAKTVGQPGPSQKTAWKEPGTAPVACLGSDPLTGTGQSRPEQQSQPACARQKLTPRKVRWGWERAAWQALRVPAEGKPWRGSLQCPSLHAVHLCAHSGPAGDLCHVWPQMGPAENTWSPWDTWPRGHQGNPKGKNGPSKEEGRKGQGSGPLSPGAWNKAGQCKVGSSALPTAPVEPHWIILFLVLALFLNCGSTCDTCDTCTSSHWHLTTCNDTKTRSGI